MIWPVAITQVDWKIFIDTCQKHLNISPTRGLDSAGLKVTSPAAYLGSLDMENEPLRALRQGGAQFEHFSVSFLMVLEDNDIINIIRETGIKLYPKAMRRDYLALATGTMSEWLKASLEFCSGEHSYEIQLLFNEVVKVLEQIGFKHIFSRHTKQKNTDGTWSFK